jgi:hypothetical protein
MQFSSLGYMSPNLSTHDTADGTLIDTEIGGDISLGKSGGGQCSDLADLVVGPSRIPVPDAPWHCVRMRAGWAQLRQAPLTSGVAEIVALRAKE